jgi:hypothetical protein
MSTISRSDPRIPPELRTPPPRSVRIRRFTTVFFVAIFFAVTLLLVTWCTVEPILYYHSPIVRATVTKLNISATRKNTYYNVYYRYPSGSAQLDDHSAVTHDLYSALHVGDPIMVHAMTIGSWHFTEPDAPSGNFLLGLLIIGFIAIVWIGLTALIARAGWFRPRQLIRDGEPLIGQIVDKKMVMAGRRPARQLTYEYQAPGQQPMAGRMIVRSDEYAAAVLGAQVVVIYDPGRPSRSIIYDYADFAAG